MTARRNIAALIVAAGRGTRMGGDIPKQYQLLMGRPVLARTYAILADHPEIMHVAVVIDPTDEPLAQAVLPEDAQTVPGGATRSASVAAGLAALPPETTHVLIHDAARPLLPASVIDRVIGALETSPGAAPALPVTDALWKGQDGAVMQSVSRDGIFRAQTPQGFELAAIRAAYATTPQPAADDVEIALGAGLRVAIVDGHEDNLKLTHPPDTLRAQRILASQTDRTAMDDLRLGNGFDVHRFGTGNQVILCGIPLPHGQGLDGHSDADVGMHAITDAIYGALAEGDIGRHFPPSEPQWCGADSSIFLAHAVALVAERGYRIANVDCTLVCERPKIGPHSDAMRTRLSEILQIPADRVSVKATTSERLGFTGREEGIAALATAALVRG